MFLIISVSLAVDQGDLCTCERYPCLFWLNWASATPVFGRQALTLQLNDVMRGTMQISVIFYNDTFLWILQASLHWNIMHDQRWSPHLLRSLLEKVCKPSWCYQLKLNASELSFSLRICFVLAFHTCTTELVAIL